MDITPILKTTGIEIAIPENFGVDDELEVCLIFPGGVVSISDDDFERLSFTIFGDPLSFTSIEICGVANCTVNPAPPPPPGVCPPGNTMMTSITNQENMTNSISVSLQPVETQDACVLNGENSFGCQDVCYIVTQTGEPEVSLIRISAPDCVSPNSFDAVLDVLVNGEYCERLAHADKVEEVRKT